MRWLWIGIFSAVLVWSGIGPKDFVTWCLEVAPAVLGALVLWVTRESFPLTPLVYGLILFHCVVLMVGGHYTYAEVPLGEWLRELVDGSRNNYDKLGHLAQGFVPAMIARELMIRLHVFNSTRWRDFYIVSFCLGCCPTRPPRPFWEPRATPGTRSPTWAGRCSVPSRPCCCSLACMTGNCMNAVSYPRSE